MSDIAIKVENLSKRYRIGLEEELPDTLVGALTQAVKRPLRNWRRLRRLTHFGNGSDGGPSQPADLPTSQPSNSSSVRADVDRDTLWALRDVSFEVKRGEVVGIIGRNGAGKSTLLKILARITHPTSGRVELHGRVGSLLEVGTGFHPELTGRENIYMNGTLLGMTKAEVDRKFDEIVDFSGVEKFIDTPVKRYSSGMRVRLAFSVAAHLEPEILLVDEVLAVGDAAFQKRCLGKMREVSKEGRTVLFVSHRMEAVGELCERAILIQDGTILEDGYSKKVVALYLREDVSQLASVEWRREEAPKCDELILKSVKIVDRCGNVKSLFSSKEDILIVAEYEVLIPDRMTRVWIRISTTEGADVLSTHDGDAWDRMEPRPKGVFTSRCVIPGGLLNTREYLVNLAVSTIKGTSIRSRSFLAIEVFDPDRSLSSHHSHRGVIRPKLDWKITRVL